MNFHAFLEARPARGLAADLVTYNGALSACEKGSR